MSNWTKEPPSEAGFYYQRKEKGYITTIFLIRPRPLFSELWAYEVDGTEHLPFFIGGEWLRIPYPEILLAMQQVVDAATRIVEHGRNSTTIHEFYVATEEYMDLKAADAGEET